MKHRSRNPYSLLGGFVALLIVICLGSMRAKAAGVIQVPLASVESIAAGSVISQSGDAFALSSKAYDKRFFGVVTAQEATDGLVSVLQSGLASVLVETPPVPFVAGDLVASSGQPGLGQKAIRSGYVIGVVSGNYQDLGNNQGLVDVILSPHYAVINSSQVAAGYAQATSLIGGSPELVIRYATIAVILYIALILAAFTFGRSARAGIIALGRNPLAKKVILVGIVVNLGLSLALVGVGWWLGYLILTS